MTTFLRFGATVFFWFIVVSFLAAAIVLIGGVQAAYGADVVSATPLPQPDSGGLTIAWLRDLAAIIALIAIIWRVWVSGILGKVSALLDHELEKRNPHMPGAPLAADMASDDPWASEADKVAPPPPAPPARPKPHVVSTASARDMAKKFKAQGKA